MNICHKSIWGPIQNIAIDKKQKQKNSLASNYTNTNSQSFSQIGNWQLSEAVWLSNIQSFGKKYFQYYYNNYCFYFCYCYYYYLKVKGDPPLLFLLPLRPNVQSHLFCCLNLFSSYLWKLTDISRNIVKGTMDPGVYCFNQ